MIKKAIIFSIAAAIIGGIGYVVYIAYIVNDALSSAPEIMEAVEGQFLESCEFEYECIKAVEGHFEDCQAENYMTNVNLFNFNKKYLKFTMNMHQCIEESSSYELPSFADYMAERALDDIESSEKEASNSGVSTSRELTGNETLEELLLYQGSLEAYKKYKDKGRHKAFAADGLGYYGWASNYKFENLAVFHALKTCNEGRYPSKSECFVVDINGEFVYPYQSESPQE